MEVKELVKALRCSATPGGAESCAGCSYRVVDRVSDEDAAKYGFVPGAEFESCDTDRMALDAADLLEKLNAERDAAVKDLKNAIFDDCTNSCTFCAHQNPKLKAPYCLAYFCENDEWQWRGLEGRKEL